MAMLTSLPTRTRTDLARKILAFFVRVAALNGD